MQILKRMHCIAQIITRSNKQRSFFWDSLGDQEHAFSFWNIFITNLVERTH
jgi:hypothetical protein